MATELTFQLSEPITTHKGQVSELVLKQVKARAFIKYGMPFKEITSGPREDRRTHHEFDYTAVVGFVSEATGIDSILLSEISGADMVPLGYKVLELLASRPNV